MLDLSRLSVFVDTENSGVQVVPRIFEIVRVTAEESDRRFRRPNQTHVGVFFVLVEVILPTTVESDHI